MTDLETYRIHLDAGNDAAADRLLERVSGRQPPIANSWEDEIPWGSLVLFCLLGGWFFFGR